jgi:phenylacetate-CoA oxygenase PaaJ subunit
MSGTTGPTEADVRAALETVEDPEIPMSVVDLGLIYGVEIEGGAVVVDMTLTSLGCPAEEMLREDIEAAVRDVEGVTEAETNLVWDPPWTPERMTDAGRETLREFGITV